MCRRNFIHICTRIAMLIYSKFWFIIVGSSNKNLFPWRCLLSRRCRLSCIALLMVPLVYQQDLCHAHAQQALIQRKIQTIIDCFLNSAIAPELQIDIPIEMADKLMERLSGRNPSIHPYVFREAQVKKLEGNTPRVSWKNSAKYETTLPHLGHMQCKIKMPARFSLFLFRWPFFEFFLTTGRSS